jgi:hypothetical protein
MEESNILPHVICAGFYITGIIIFVIYNKFKLKILDLSIRQDRIEKKVDQIMEKK